MQRSRQRSSQRRIIVLIPYACERDCRGNRRLKLNYWQLGQNLWSLRKSVLALLPVIRFKRRLERKARPFRVRQKRTKEKTAQQKR